MDNFYQNRFYRQLKRYDNVKGSSFASGVYLEAVIQELVKSILIGANLNKQDHEPMISDEHVTQFINQDEEFLKLTKEITQTSREGYLENDDDSEDSEKLEDD